MNLQLRLIGTTLMVVTGLGLSYPTWQSVAQAETTTKPAQVAQRLSVCRQVGDDYREMYTIVEENRTITICQKGSKYYYIHTSK
ncbi:MAG: hypothetical protein IGS48_23695 [Oscillatoriales cyanobacterium C42_A2020_001]|nr:hypothetical protein [Leptolyngbyaceae cyanobacterium C42_A2020_001]